jgi:hypothetical protein
MAAALITTQKYWQMHICKNDMVQATLIKVNRCMSGKPFFINIYELIRKTLCPIDFAFIS